MWFVKLINNGVEENNNFDECSDYTLDSDQWPRSVKYIISQCLPWIRLGMNQKTYLAHIFVLDSAVFQRIS